VVRDQHLKTTLKNSGIQCQSFNGSLLFEPWDVLKKDQTPYRVFTPFFQKGCLAAGAPRLPLSAPENPSYVRDGTLCIHDLGLLPAYPWHKGLEQSWTIGEAGAKERLKEFLEIGLNGYKEGRNFPEKPKVSRLSPHLHFGEISPNQVWYAAQGSGCNETDLGHFLSELGWREFSNHLLYHTPSLPEKNLQNKFDQFPWKEDPVALKRWQEGQTGYPIVDAGLRELWQTGYMHNRVRMIVASFLVKNLLIHWTHGAQWFWDCLVDADLANNSASWQWVAGCGADAAPYFRIFNPITQAEKFDPQGAYIRRFVPELEKLHTPYLFAPWTAPQSILNKAGVILGQTYPAPIVQVDTSRKRALDAFSALKNESL
jgi:deoxyribodipyrimidine photo-lyase